MRKDRQNEEWLVRLNETIQQHINEHQLSAAYLAELMGLSQRQFYRKVKALTHTTPNDYLNDIRFQVAYEYLQSDTYTTIATTANAVGFKDAHYFSRKFKERYGVSPLEV